MNAGDLGVASLREEFDAAFTRHADTRPEMEHFIGLGAGGRSWAVRLTEVASVHVATPVTRLPGAPPELLGVSRVRDTLFPVLDLAATLGLPADATTRWLLLSAATPTLGIAFAAYEGHIDVPHHTVAAATDDAADIVTPAVLTHGGQARPVVSVRALHLRQQAITSRGAP